MLFWTDGGYCWAASDALENDFVSSLWTLSETFLPGSGDRRGRRGRVAGGQEGPHDRLQDRAAQVALQVGRPRGHPARRTGTEPVRECEAGVPARPTPMPTKAYASATFQYEMSSFQRISIARKPSRTKT